MKKLIGMALALGCVAAAGRLAYAADNGTEFGIEDDLTVLGKAGTAADPDVEIKGFAVFGSTQADYLIPVDTGNVVMNGIVQISSGLYSAGSSTFAARGAFQSTVAYNGNTGALTNLFFDNAAANSGKVLKATANGFLDWETDISGLPALGSVRRLQMVDDAGTGLMNSAFLQNALDTNITMVNSSMTIKGAFESTDTFKADADVYLGDTNADKINIAGDATVMNGSSMTVTGNLLANGDSQLGDAKTDIHGINTAAESGTALKVQGNDVSGQYVAKFYSGDPAVAGNLAAWIKKK